MPQRYLRIFCPEAEDHLASLRSGLLVLEKNPSRGTLLPELLRSAHTLKGSALMVGLHDIAAITDRIEAQLKRMTCGEEAIDAPAIDFLIKGVDAITLINKALAREEQLELNVARFLDEYHPSKLWRVRHEQREAGAGQLSETARAAFRTFDTLQHLIGEMSVKKRRLEGRLTRVMELAQSVTPASEAVLGGFRRELEDDLLYLDYLIQELHEKAGEACAPEAVRDLRLAGVLAGAGA
ncbi:Hpt domain-containing protein [Geomonas sp.]|uniref:Hpt domain-containing protein n=1 Tax=Geomonas sp. TaxID=2651584 RepID=UPI002B46207D|nr:Hpt domain-containing protein [Geomonas sp.]HJV36848.1 Hpt domain-containing protein [Geomonas sp.]